MLKKPSSDLSVGEVTGGSVFEITLTGMATQ